MRFTLLQQLWPRPRRRMANHHATVYSRPTVERLEAREILATFTWKPTHAVGGVYLWRDGANWQGGNGTNWPSAVADTAYFKGGAGFDVNCKLDGAVSIGTLDSSLGGGYTSTLTLAANLTVQTLNFASTGTINLSATSVTLEITGAGSTSSVWQGSITGTGSGTSFSTVKLDAGASLLIQNGSGATFSGKLDILGTAKLSSQTDRLKVGSGYILVESGGTLEFKQALQKPNLTYYPGGFASSDSSNYIENQGTVNCNQGDAVTNYYSAVPLWNDASTSDLEVFGGSTMAFTGANSKTGGASIEQDAGKIVFNTGIASATLQVSQGYKQLAGSLVVVGSQIGGATAYFQIDATNYPNAVFNFQGGSIYLGDYQQAEFPTLSVNGAVQLTETSIYVDVAGLTSGKCGLLSDTNSSQTVTVNGACYVFPFNSSGALNPGTWVIISAAGGLTLNADLNVDSSWTGGHGHNSYGWWLSD